MVAVLIAEDSPTVLKIIATHLTMSGFIVTLTLNGEEAMAALRSKPFDVLLTDYRMPKMNGLQLAERAKKLYPDMPVIMFTSNFAELETLAPPHIDRLLQKSEELELIPEVIRHLLAGKQVLEDNA